MSQDDACAAPFTKHAAKGLAQPNPCGDDAPVVGVAEQYFKKRST